MDANAKPGEAAAKLDLSTELLGASTNNCSEVSIDHPYSALRDKAKISFALVAATPPIFAACTWNDGSAPGIGIDLRLIGLPVLAVEIAFILLAFFDGWRVFHQARALSTITKLLLGCLICTALASAILAAPDPEGALLWTYISLVHLAFGFSVAWRIENADGLASKLIWPWVVAGCGAYAAIAAVYAARPHPARFDWEYFGLGVSNMRQIGFYCVVGAMAAIGCSAQARGAKAFGFTAASTAMLALACWTGSRGALLACLIGVGTLWMLAGRFRTPRAVALSIFPLMAGATLSLLLPVPASIFGVPRMLASISNLHTNDLTSGRFRMWVGAWHAFERRPFLGYGEGQFGRIVPQVQGIYLHPHNLILQLLFQWGVIGTATTAMIGVLVVRNLRTKDLTDERHILPAFLVLVALFGYSFYDGTLFHAYPTMMFAFALASVLTAPATDGDRTSVGKRFV